MELERLRDAVREAHLSDLSSHQISAEKGAEAETLPTCFLGGCLTCSSGCAVGCQSGCLWSSQSGG